MEKRYKITIREYEADESDGEYKSGTDIYEQTVKNLNIPAIVLLVNGAEATIVK